MEELLKEIIKGKKEYEQGARNSALNKGIGSKAYVIKRIDLLREQLLEIKKDLEG